MSNQSPAPMSTPSRDLSNSLVPVEGAIGGDGDISKTVEITVHSYFSEIKYEDGKPDCPPETAHLYKKLKLEFYTSDRDKWDNEIISKMADHITCLDLVLYDPIKKDQIEQILMKLTNLEQLTFELIHSEKFQEVEGILSLLKSNTSENVEIDGLFSILKKAHKITVEIIADHEDILQKILNAKLHEIPNLHWIFSWHGTGPDEIQSVIDNNTFSRIASGFRNTEIIVEIRDSDREQKDSELILQKIHNAKLYEIPNIQWIYFWEGTTGFEIEFLTNKLRLVPLELRDNLNFKLTFTGVENEEELNPIAAFFSTYTKQIQACDLTIVLNEEGFPSEEVLQIGLAQWSQYITRLRVYNVMKNTYWNIMPANVEWKKLTELELMSNIDGSCMLFHRPLTFLSHTPELKRLYIHADFNLILGGDDSSSEEKKNLIKLYFDENKLPKLKELTIACLFTRPFFKEGTEFDISLLQSCLPFTKVVYLYDRYLYDPLHLELESN